MLDRVYCCPCRTGDLLILLPLLYADAQAGLTVGLVVHRDYTAILDGVSYVTPIVFEGDLADLEGAIALAETHSNNVISIPVLSTPETAKNIYAKAGLDGPQSDSFAKEIYRLAGRIKDFQHNLPLVFDRRSPERELALIQNLNPTKAISRQRKYILVAADGGASAFPYKDLLFQLIRNHFVGALTFKATVIDLGQIKAERFYDLLGLYDRSVCLVACDSAPLHLAQACPRLPVCALLQDKPALNYGSAWRPQYISCIRYSDFPKRAVQMLDAIASLKKPGSILPTLVPGPKLIHAYSAYELNGEHAKAKTTWEREYLTGRWIATPIELGALGRDSKTVLKDEKRLPFLKDAIRLAGMRAKDDDIIVLTRDATCFEDGLTERITGEHPVYAHRRFREPETYHPVIDFFAFSKSWWKEHRDEVPDMILGKDFLWSRVLMEVMKRHGGKKLQHAVYRDNKPTPK